jgi:hypothetical protein
MSGAKSRRPSALMSKADAKSPDNDLGLPMSCRAVAAERKRLTRAG